MLRSCHPQVQLTPVRVNMVLLNMVDQFLFWPTSIPPCSSASDIQSGSQC